jgi:hypothetical protein
MATEQPPEEQVLRRLERRLDEASAAAERLIAEAAASAATGARDRRPPPAGWQAPADGTATATPGAGASDRDAELLGEVLQRLRGLIPPELQQRLAKALREVLLALRALLDWYIERLERRRAEPTEVHDIPIS